ncbi:MAG: hypothetical protein M3Y56_01360 [Armatimonadota bacterium]|nr:hypothetical protein [Armatimonadota bacterium]
MDDNRATRPTLFLHEPIRRRLSPFRALAYVAAGSLVGVFVAFFMFAVIMGNGYFGPESFRALPPFLENLPQVDLPLVVMGALTGFTFALAQAGRTRAACGIATVCSLLTVIPLILLCVMTMSYGLQFGAWLAASPLLLWGWSLNRWSKRLRESI